MWGPLKDRDFKVALADTIKFYLKDVFLQHTPQLGIRQSVNCPVIIGYRFVVMADEERCSHPCLK